LFNALVAIFPIIQMRIKSLALGSSKTQDFDTKLQVLHQQMRKQVVTVLSTFFSFMVTFKEHKAHNILSMMLAPCYKGLGLVIQYVGKDKTMQIICEYDKYVLFPFLVHAYKNFNPIVAMKLLFPL